MFACIILLDVVHIGRVAEGRERKKIATQVKTQKRRPAIPKLCVYLRGMLSRMWSLDYQVLLDGKQKLRTNEMLYEV